MGRGEMEPPSSSYQSVSEIVISSPFRLRVPQVFLDEHLEVSLQRGNYFKNQRGNGSQFRSLKMRQAPPPIKQNETKETKGWGCVKLETQTLASCKLSSGREELSLAVTGSLTQPLSLSHWGCSWRNSSGLQPTRCPERSHCFCNHSPAPPATSAHHPLSCLPGLSSHWGILSKVML